MAWIFSLSAEFGTRRDAERFAAHWPSSLTRKNGKVHALRTNFESSGDGGGWCQVAPNGVSMGGVTSTEDQEEMDELAVMMLEHLRTAPFFRYASVGVEVCGFRELGELDQDLVKLDFNGLVISTDLWKSLGSPPIFEPFSDDHVWRPFIRVR